jgi:hypothetical protein
MSSLPAYKTYSTHFINKTVMENEILEGNSLIVKFLGIVLKSWVSPEDLHYHNDLAHLDVVIDKLQEKGMYTCEEYIPHFDTHSFKIGDGKNDIVAHHFGKDKTTVKYQTVVDCIKWLNSKAKKI